VPGEASLSGKRLKNDGIGVAEVRGRGLSRQNPTEENNNAHWVGDVNMQRVFVVWIVGLLLLPVGAVHAVPVIINTTYDLTNGFNRIWALDDGPVTIANGDSVDLTVSFSGGLALTIGDGNEIFRGWLAAGGNESKFIIDNAIIEFLGFSGTGGAAPLNLLGTQDGRFAHLGPFVSSFLSAGQTATFTGYKVTYDVREIETSPQDYSKLWFLVGGDDLSIGPALVSAPASLALVCLGFVGLGLLKRAV